jgi:hypothetical protein
VNSSRRFRSLSFLDGRGGRLAGIVLVDGDGCCWVEVVEDVVDEDGFCMEEAG